MSIKDAVARLAQRLDAAGAALKLISEDESGQRAGPERWSKKEMLGHLIDSACNNHQRFVRAQLAPAVELPGYAQEEWVRIQQYQSRPWSELIGLWAALNQHLLAIVRAVPASALENTCAIGGKAPVTLVFLIEDYVRHLEHHLEQILGAARDRTEELQALYRGEWWTNRRELPDIERMLGHTEEVILLRDPVRGDLTGFARVLTDRVYKGLILDVIVTPSARGQGLGRKLIDSILNHPRLASVSHFELYCRREMAAFYEKWGFTVELGDLHFMRLTR